MLFKADSLFIRSDGVQVGSRTCANVQIGQKVSYHNTSNHQLT